jgi:UDP-glucose 4-epimerase
MSGRETVVVTGCSGFIGSNVVDRLLAEGYCVIGVDNFSSGQREFIRPALRNARFRLYEQDLLDVEKLKRAFRGGEIVVHLAANADVRFGTKHPRMDLEQNTIATHNVLEAMRANGIGRIAFSSTGSVYGETQVIPTPEDAPFPLQTSLYGASKLAGEGLIAAYCEGFGFRSWIFRFVSILGARYTHGHVLDFYRQLREHPGSLRVLGDGRQRKSYLHVDDCIDAVLLAMRKADAKVSVFNLGVDAYCEVNDSIGWICAALGVQPTVEYTGGDRGWVGDNPFIFLDTRRIRALGWVPRYSIQDAVVRTVEYLRENEWVLEARG